jgi:flagellar biogenesis protein FliO
MPESARWVNEIGVVLVLSATIMSLFVVSRLVAVLGFLLTACWALLAVALATDSNSVRNTAVLAIVIMVAAVVGRILRNPDRRAVLLG